MRHSVLQTVAGKQSATKLQGDCPGAITKSGGMIRSNDQFNTTIYGYYDRFHGIEGTRDVVLMNADDMAEAGLAHGDQVALVGDAGDGVQRRLSGLSVVTFKLPRGTVGAYYPETNILVPIAHHDHLSKTPASKGVPVRIDALNA